MQPTPTYLNAEVSVKSKKDLEKLLAFCEREGFECAVAQTEVVLSSSYRTPTPAFKAVCGPEWLNTRGQISSEGAHTFLMKYVRSRGLVQPNGLIAMNDVLNGLFGVHEQSMSEYTLIQYVERLFEDGHA